MSPALEGRGNGTEEDWTEASMLKFLLLFPTQLPFTSVCLLLEQRWQADMVAFVAWREGRCGLCELLLTARSSHKCELVLFVRAELLLSELRERKKNKIKVSL